MISGRITLSCESKSQIGACFGKIRVYFKCLFVIGNGLVDSSCFTEGDSEAVECFGIFWLYADSLQTMVDGLIQFALLTQGSCYGKVCYIIVSGYIKVVLKQSYAVLPMAKLKMGTYRYSRNNQ